MKKASFSVLFLLIVFFLLQFPSVALSEGDDASGYPILGGIGGPTNTVAVHGNYLYVGKGTSILVLEYSGGKLLQVGGQLSMPAFITDLKVQDNVLYAATGNEGMYIVDISDPLKPVAVGKYNTAGYAEAIAVNGDIAYVADGEEGLQIIGVSDPENPVALGSIYKGKYAFDIKVSGNYAYIAASTDGLLIADITNSNKPKELASFDTPGVARSVELSGGLAYVADDWQGVSVVDIIDPANPVQTGLIHTAGRAHDLVLCDNRLYVADAYMGLRVFGVDDLTAVEDITSFIPADSQMIRVVASGGSIFCTDQKNGILCFDITDPCDLKLTGLYSHTVPIPLELPNDVMNFQYRDNVARLAVLGILEIKDNADLKLYDPITRSEFAVLLCNVLHEEKCNGNSKQTFTDVSKQNATYGYIEKAALLGLVSGRENGKYEPSAAVTNLEAANAILQLVHRTPATDGIMDECKKLGLMQYFEGGENEGALRGNLYAMIAKTIMEIPDTVTNRTLLQSEYGIELQCFPMNSIQTAAKDGYAYVTCGKSGLSVVDVHDPQNCIQVAHIDFPELVGHIRIYKNYIYLPGKEQLFVVDISDPMHPVCIDSLGMAPYNWGPPRGVDIDSDTLYIADEDGFKIISLKDPVKPVLINHILLRGDMQYGYTNSTSDIAVRDGTGYIAMEYDGIILYDVTDANNPVHLGTYKGEDYNNFAGNIEFCGDIGFSANNEVIDILDISDIRNPKSIGLIDDIYAAQFYNQIGEYDSIVIMPDDVNGVKILNISNPEKIEKVAGVDTTGTAANIYVDSGYAYVADSISGICVISLEPHTQAQEYEDIINSSLPGGLSKLSLDIFAGMPAENYVLSAEKALSALNNENEAFSEILTVTNTDDDGEGSLRWCLSNINEYGKIQFDINVFKPDNPAVIYSKSSLTFHSDFVTIDASNAGVIIDGSQAEEGATGIMVDNGIVIKGLKFQNFKNRSMDIWGKGNIIGGSRLEGTAPNGEGNVFVNSGGVWIGGSDNILVGNNVGVDSDGVTPLGNTGGVNLRENAVRNTIGIDLPEYRNIVSNNIDRGISAMCGSYGNLIEGNYVGTDITGTKEMGNFDGGITFELGGYGNIVRNNITCANGREGILIFDDGSSFNIIVGNSIGIGADGKTHLPNKANTVNTGGGGGSSFYNLFSDNIAYATYSDDPPIIPGIGIYETIVNGKVYKCADKDSY